MAMLLERDAELASLNSWLADAADGHGRVVFVGGEAGIGKTALATAFAASASAVRLAIGRCDALLTPRALGPFLDVAAALGLDATVDRDGLLGGLVAELRQGGPTLLVVEDAHWADDASIELLAMLGRRAPDLQLLLLVTYREDEVTSEHPLRRVIGDLVTSSATAWIGLAALSLEAVRVLVEAHDADAEQLHQRTGGNPFYVTEALAAPGQVVPTTVRLAVLARAARLRPPARAVLDAVAVVPGRAEAWLVEALCAPSSDALDECVEGGVLLAVDGSYAFRHELARLAVEGQLAEPARRELHRRAVAALRARPGADPARLAHHAEAAGDDAVLARAARDACLLAAARTAHGEAVRFGERALAVSHELPTDEVAELKMRLGTSLLGAARIDEAIALAEEAVAYWRAVGDIRREADALVLLGTGLANLGRTEDGTRLVERAATLLEREPPGTELATVYSALTSIHMLARDRDAAAMWGERAIALARDLGDTAILGRSLILAGIADVMDGRFDGLARVEEGISLGRRDGLQAVVALGLSMIGTGCGELRRYELAVPALEEGIAYATDHHVESSRLYMSAWLGRCRFDLGRWSEAEVLCREAVGVPRSIAYTRFMGLNTLGWLRARRGDGDVWPLLDEALVIAREMRHLQRLWPVAVARAEAAWLEGSLDEHVALLEEVLELALRYRHGIAAGELGLWLARAGRLAQPPPGAVDYFARWITGDHAGAVALFRQMGCPYEAADALVDRGDTASLREALATFERLGAVPMVARVGAELRSRGVRVATRRGPAVNPSGLSGRELEVLNLVSTGFTNPQIASTLYISRKTAEHHVSAILMKLGVTTRAEAAAAAVRLGVGVG